MSFDEFLNEQLKSSEIRAEYRALEEKFLLAQAEIDKETLLNRAGHLYKNTQRTFVELRAAAASGS